MAQRLTVLAGDDDPAVALAVALAVRAPRLGHVYVDLATVRDTATVESDEPVDLSGLPWPAPDEWVARLAASPLVADGPLQLEGTLPLPRSLLARGAADRGRPERVRRAPGRGGRRGAPGRRARAAVPGCGAASRSPPRRRCGAASRSSPAGRARARRRRSRGSSRCWPSRAASPLVALAAPTGKAAQRLEEAVHHEAGAIDVEPGIRDALLGLSASTIHRLLGWRPGSHSRFRHHRANRLPHDVVIVDETSMVSLSLMARLVEAVRPDARLILMGDPGQLTSIEAGAVLGDIVGPGTGEGIVVLDRVFRFGRGIASLAGAVRDGRSRRRRRGARLRAGRRHLDPRSIAADPGNAAHLTPVREGAVGAARAVIEAARGGDAESAIAALGGFRLLCAHRRGDHGVAQWTAHIEAWLGDAVDGFAGEGPWYAGRPLIVTENDYGLRLYNGDTGVVVAGRGRPGAAFERRGDVAPLPPVAARGGRDRLRDDGPQVAGLAVRDGGRPAAAAGSADPDARAALHGDHAGARAADRGRHARSWTARIEAWLGEAIDGFAGEDRGTRPAADRDGERLRVAALQRRHGRRRGRRERRAERRVRARAACCATARRGSTRSRPSTR